MRVIERKVALREARQELTLASKALAAGLGLREGVAGDRRRLRFCKANNV